MRHRRRELDQGLDTAETLRQGEQLSPLDDPAGGFQAALDLARDHAAKAGHLASRQLALRIARQPRIEHPRDVWMLAQACGPQPGVSIVLAHPDGERFESTKNEPGIERPRDAAYRVLQEGQLLQQILAV